MERRGEREKRKEQNRIERKRIKSDIRPLNHSRTLRHSSDNHPHYIIRFTTRNTEREYTARFTRKEEKKKEMSSRFARRDRIDHSLLQETSSLPSLGEDGSHFPPPSSPPTPCLCHCVPIVFASLAVDRRRNCSLRWQKTRERIARCARGRPFSSLTLRERVLALLGKTET